MKAKLIKIHEIDTDRTLLHLSGSMGEDTLCGITFVDADEDFEVQEGIDGTLQDVSCPKCFAHARYIRSIDEGVPKKENSPWKQKTQCKTCYNWLSQKDVGFDDFPKCSETDSRCIDYLNNEIKKCPKYINL